MTAPASGSLTTGDQSAEPVMIKTGDFVVTLDKYVIEVCEVTKVTALSFYRKRYGRETRQLSHSVVFSGPESVARNLAEKLVASRVEKANDDSPFI
jgi:hypothetical protein